jgi:hypothetical protein
MSAQLRFRCSPVILPVVLCALAPLAATPAGAQLPDNLRMQNVIRQVVKGNGYEVVGLGSWIKGSYKPGKSDHDLRLIISGTNLNPQQQLAAWQEARAKLVEAVRNEFGDEAESMLQRTNLYPPSQLMGGVEDLDDAVSRFATLGQVPNLGYTKKVTPDVDPKWAEGIYGKGADVFTEGYEKTNGKLFYRGSSGNCLTGLADVGMFDVTKKFTTGGTANTAIQWIEHCGVALAQNNGKDVAKDVQRIWRDMSKARSLAGLPVDTALQQRLEYIFTTLKSQKNADALQGMLPAFREELPELLANAQMQAAILKGYDEAGPVGRAYQGFLLSLMEAKGSRGGKALAEIWEAVGNVITFERAMTTLQAYWAAQDTAEAGFEGGVGEALRTALPALADLAGLPVSTLMDLTNEIMKQAEANGYVFVANRQEAWDLMHGIYTAIGRSQDDPDPRHVYSLDRLVQECHDEKKLEALVYAQSLRASCRDLEGAPEEVDRKVAGEIQARCWPVIRDAWRTRRDALVREYLLIAAQVVRQPLRIDCPPAVLRNGSVTVLLHASGGSQMSARLDRMVEIIKLLSGADATVALSWYWEPAAPLATDLRPSERRYTFTKPGTYPVQVRFNMTPRAPTSPPPEAIRVLLERNIAAGVDVVVVEEQPAAGEWKLVGTETVNRTKDSEASGPSSADYIGTAAGTVVPDEGSPGATVRAVGKPGSLTVTTKYLNEKGTSTGLAIAQVQSTLTWQLGDVSTLTPGTKVTLSASIAQTASGSGASKYSDWAALDAGWWPYRKGEPGAPQAGGIKVIQYLRTGEETHKASGQGSFFVPAGTRAGERCEIVLGLTVERGPVYFYYTYEWVPQGQ